MGKDFAFSLGRNAVSPLLPPIVPCTGSLCSRSLNWCQSLFTGSELREGEAVWLLEAARTLNTVAATVWWTVSLKHSLKESPLASCLRGGPSREHTCPARGMCSRHCPFNCLSSIWGLRSPRAGSGGQCLIHHVTYLTDTDLAGSGSLSKCAEWRKGKNVSVKRPVLIFHFNNSHWAAGFKVILTQK